MTSAQSTNSPPKWAGVSRCEVTLRRELVPKAGSTARGFVHRFGSRGWDWSDKQPGSRYLEFAKANAFVVVSTDLDFYDLATTLGPPPKVVWLRRWTPDCRCGAGAPARGYPNRGIRGRSGTRGAGSGSGLRIDVCCGRVGKADSGGILATLPRTPYPNLITVGFRCGSVYKCRALQSAVPITAWCCRYPRGQ